VKIILFGATGMVGQGVLRECLLDPEVTVIQTVGRTSPGLTDKKLKDLVLNDLENLSAVEAQLVDFDLCLFCLGVSSAGMGEEKYKRLTYDLTLTVAETLVRLNPKLTFVYVSGRSTDSSEKGPVMWARIKGRTENDLAKLPFKAVFNLRPAAILPVHGERSKTPAYRILYILLGPLLPLARKLFPMQVTTTERLAKVMIALGKIGYPKTILETEDIENFPIQKVSGPFRARKVPDTF
jgi:uncharacterized protein YbjT (DUF2867 family)